MEEIALSDPAGGFDLGSRYTADRGRIYLTGVHAIVRGLLDQRRADAAAGLDNGGFISGYPGSPLGGVDRELERQAPLLERYGIRHVPGLNEELAATSVWGSQLSAGSPGATVDGVTGAWYGKAPGVDRAGDALRHANYSGTGPAGGAVAFVGEDPRSKSSTLPSGAAETLAALCIPTFAPANLQELLDFTLHAFACSRASATWSAIRIRTDLADGSGSVSVAPDRLRIQRPLLDDGEIYRHTPSANLNHVVMRDLEESLFSVRLPLASSYGALNGLNSVRAPVPGAWLGVAADGQSYLETVAALEDLGLDEQTCDRVGIRLLKVGMPYPLEREVVREFAAGLETILVVENKLPFVERALRDALYDVSAPPRVLGKRDHEGGSLLASAGELGSDDIARALAAVLAGRVSLDSIDAHLERLDQMPPPAPPLPVSRGPFFCSGCPHNLSTQAPDDVLVGAGIGCHSIVVLNQQDRGEIAGITQMGGEGAQWFGMAPFLEREHFVQNVGDGTFHHSASLAVRAAVAAGVNITFKLLYNGGIAMTGGQGVPGQRTPAEITELLAAEGVARTVITAEDPSLYRGARLAGNAGVRDRGELLEVQRELAGVPGVTVLIHDQRCAAEKRRLRKRGQLEEPVERVHINERVCEGCGDCGRKSGCLSVQPVETEWGRKTQIDQGSCNKDYSCLEGDCPSFLTVVPGKGAPAQAPPRVPIALPEPRMRVPSEDFTVRMPGIGGTGVVTVAQILGVAAMSEGRHVWGVDQTGLSQKAGQVISDVRISTAPIAGSNRPGVGGADLLLGFDLLGAASSELLRSADPGRTIAVLSTSAVATGEMVVDSAVSWPGNERLLARIGARTRGEENLELDAQALCERLFGDKMPANLLLLGAAFQHGAVPVSAAAIERAIELNGVAVELNQLAFAWGRALAIEPGLVEREVPVPAPQLTALPPGLEGAVGAFGEGELGAAVRERAADLAAYQDTGYAREYLRFVATVRRREDEVTPGEEAIALAVARNLHKLMSYKDEYEVARLLLDAGERAAVESRYGPDAKVSWNLHPPLLRSLGMKRKLRLGPRFEPALRALRAGRRLRGGPFDPLGRTRVRRVERQLIGDYRGAVAQALELLRPDTVAGVLELCELPEEIRGYERLKLESAAAFEEAAAAVLRRLGGESRRRVLPLA
jgi:indolepyruvate ferredoxin oxidoreductase